MERLLSGTPLEARSAEERAQISAHLAQCATCRGRWRSEFPTQEIGDAVRSLRSDKSLKDNILRRISPQASPTSGQEPKEGTVEPRRLGSFELLGRLGEGGMGTVLKARHVSMDRLVALKILPQKLAEDEVFVQRFLREARSAARLRHANIVQAYDAGYADGCYYFAMEYVDGETLSAVLQREGPLEQNRALGILKQVASALAAAHRAGIVHRDIKPSNIMLDREGEVRVTDFGLAKCTEGDISVTADGHALGTPGYVSPEMAKGGQADARSDLYSLGATFFHALAGRPPFEGKTFSEVVIKQVNEPAPPLATLAPHVDPRLCGILDRLLQKAPEARHPSAQELLAELESLGPLQSAGEAARAEGRAMIQEAPTLPLSPGRRLEREAALEALQKAHRPRRRRGPYLAGTVALILLLALVVGVWRPWRRAMRPDLAAAPGASHAIVPRPADPVEEQAAALFRQAQNASDAREWDTAAQRLARLDAEHARTKFRLEHTDAIAALRARVQDGAKLEPTRTPPPEQGDWVLLFDGRSLDGWRTVEHFSVPAGFGDGKGGSASVRDGQLILERGRPATGITWTGEFPRTDYELSLEAMRVSGSDCFCAIVFPVGQAHTNLSIGGWGGTVVGLEGLDNLSAPQSPAARRMTFEAGRWYRVHLRVTPARIEAHIEKEKVVDLSLAGHTFGRFGHREVLQPFGIGTFWSTGALRDIRIRRLGGEEGPAQYTNPLGMQFVKIPAGEFRMGSAEEKVKALLAKHPEDKWVQDNVPAEAPEHKVRITAAFLVGRYEVTVGQFGRFAEATGYKTEAERGRGAEVCVGRTWTRKVDANWRNPYFAQTELHPVVCVSWNDAKAFCQWLNRADAGKLQGWEYRLPTEAEWEYAASGPESLDYPWGNEWDGTRCNSADRRASLGYGDVKIDDGYARTAPVGSYSPRGDSPSGVADMSGNVCEWCEDVFSRDYYGRSPTDGPLNLGGHTNRVIRGDGWNSVSTGCRTKYRGAGYDPSSGDCVIGFRVVLAPLRKEPPMPQYLVVDLSAGPRADRYPVTALLDAPPADLLTNKEGPGGANMFKTTHIVLRRLPAGKFLMGSPQGEPGREAGEDQHEVTLTAGCFAGVFEVTQAQYQNVMGSDPSKFRGKAANPVENVSWPDVRGGTWPGGRPAADSFLGRLAARTGLEFDLPTEAQWEYACRAGSTTAFCFGDEAQRAAEYVWWWLGPDRDTTHEAGTKRPNAWGLFDAHGNVKEWCLDLWGLYPQGHVTDPVGPATPDPRGGRLAGRVRRGGCWGDSKLESCRSAGRDPLEPDHPNDGTGFRVFLTASARTNVYRNFLGMSFVQIPHGEFMMGNTDEQFQALLAEHPDDKWVQKFTPAGTPLHKVRITRPFFLGCCEVTQAQYEAATGADPSQFKGAKKPVEKVAWHEAKAFCEWLNANDAARPAGWAYRLPTEAEWEYACRDGRTATYSFGDDEGGVGEYAWFKNNSGGQPHDVATRRAVRWLLHDEKGNAWGLYDMLGNVAEWCEDWYADDYYKSSPTDDPLNAKEGRSRALRGGSWGNEAWHIRCAARMHATPDYRNENIGFRIALVPSLQAGAGVPLTPEELHAALKAKNPEYNGKGQFKVEDGKVLVVNLNTCGISDLSPLKGMPLTQLYCQSNQITNLTPLADMKLEALCFTPAKVTKGIDAIRGLPTLKKIGDNPGASAPDHLLDAAEFWRRYDAGEFTGPAAELRAALKAANPAYNGQGQFTLREGKIVEAHLANSSVADLSPLKGLPLEKLDLRFCRQLGDLTPLEGAPLKHLVVQGSKVGTLAPLKGMPLEFIDITECANLTDISALKGMPLTQLNLHSCPSLESLDALEGMKLTVLNTEGCSKLKDVSPLRGMPLAYFNLRGTKVTDLTPLKGAPLREVYLDHSSVSDLAPLKGTPIETLVMHQALVADLTPLEGMPLKTLIFDPARAAKGIQLIRAMKSLGCIGATWEQRGQPAAEFWKRYDAGELRKP